MKITSTLKLIGGALILLLTTTFGVRAGSIINDFTVPFDFTTNGVQGTMWDGIYLGQGDVPGSAQNTANGGGFTVAANTTFFGNSLYVSSSSGGWEGNQDDGFFLYKYVAGDFDMSVEILASSTTPFSAQNYHFAGVLARATPFPQGLPWTPGATNNTETLLNMTRFQEFSIGDSARNSSNGVLTVTDNFPGADSDTNSTRYVRLVRSGNTFTFYDKTNAGDAWALEATMSRPDLTGIIMQVGIEDAVYTGNTPFAAFTDFELSGTNVTDPTTLTPPSDPTGVTFSSPHTDGHVTISWTPGAGSSGSLVLLRNGTNAPLTQMPPYGYTFVGQSDTNFQSSSNSFGGSGYHLMYAGSGNSVTLGGLGGSNNTYSALVFSYLNSAPTTTYGINPATASTLGPGILTNVTFALNTTNIPVGGAAGATVNASYSTGDSYDVSASPTTLWSSSNPSSALATNGTVNGLVPGTGITITANYGGVIGTGEVNVNLAAFTDNFTGNHDFVSLGVAGSMWDGLYIQPGDVPNGNNGGRTAFCPTNNINITGTNLLSIRAGGTGWEGAADNGYFLFKNVTGDFQMAVHVSNIVHDAYQYAGLMARAANADGSPLSGGETHVNEWFFDQFSIPVAARFTVGNNTTFQDQSGTTPFGEIWLLLTRVNGTNFYCFQKLNPSDPWTFLPTATMVVPSLAGVALQVGIAQATYTTTPAELVQLDNFMLDAAGIDTNNANASPPPPATSVAMVSNPDLSLTLNWVSADALGHPLQSMVVMRAGAPVNAAPEYGFLFSGNTNFGLGSSLGSGNYCVFRSANPPASTNNTVTVTGLSPGVTYYAAVFTFTGTSTSKIFGSVSAPGVAVLNGTLLGLQTVLSSNAIPAGGVSAPAIYGVFTNNTLVAVNPAIINVTSDDTAIAVGTNGVVTGLAPGSTVVHFDYQGFTNNLPVTVRAPGFTDNFGTSWNYAASGAAGSGWDGVYLGGGYIPGQGGANADGTVSDADANMTLTNSLTVTSTLTDWAGTNDDGFFLFKYVPGDFQASVHITSQTITVNYLFDGILARAFGTNGAPMLVGTNHLENWVYLGQFDQFNDDVESRFAFNGGDNEHPGFPGTNNWYMLMKRDQGTNFSFFKKLNPTDPYIPLNSQDFAQRQLKGGMPLQVGLFAATYTSLSGTVQFDSFMLDSAGGVPIKAFLQGGSLIVEWPTIAGATLLSSPSLSTPNWQPVAAPQNQTGDGYTFVSLTPNGSYTFFRLLQ